MSPHTADVIGWGILATGKIAHSFVSDLLLVPDHRLAAVGSRDGERARAFADQYDDQAAAYSSYDELVADPRVDVVYVASPHALHLEHARLALEAGKHVLCEKPLTLNVAEAKEMFDVAAAHDLFCMEAMWTACHPVVRGLARRLHQGEFGTPRHLHAELGFTVDAGPDDRMLDPALGAGALLDMGIYPLTFAHLMLGEAEQLSGTAVLSGRGVDLDVAMTGRHPGGALSTMTASMTSWSSRAAWIATDRGRIEVPEFHHPTHATFTAYDDAADTGQGHAGPVRIEGDENVIGRGYGHEIAEVGRCLRAGLSQSPLVPHAQTLTLLGQIDRLREQLGVRYPADG